jgi:hypothetical protein
MSSFFGMPLSQFPNKLVMFFSGANPNVIKITRKNGAAARRVPDAIIFCSSDGS